MLAQLRKTACRYTVVGTMVTSMLVVSAVPFLRTSRDHGSEAAVEWLRKRLHVSSDANFDRAIRVALAASPRSIDHFLEVFSAEYDASSSVRTRLAVLLGLSDAPLRHFLGSGSVTVGSAAVYLRKKKSTLSIETSSLLRPPNLLSPLLSCVVAGTNGAPNPSWLILSLNAALPNGP